MIRPCTQEDFPEILAIINDGATAYRGFVPEDCLGDPYMPASALSHEISSGVRFWGYEKDRSLIGVMGIQDVQDVTLIRHAYVRTLSRNQGIGDRLMSHLKTLTKRPLLIGTWKDASWAIRFYEKRGFSLAPIEERDRLLAKYWSIPDRQREVSVVLHEIKVAVPHPG
jgi:GNAT superfamily N-acetyltransferase